ncbi:YdcF family protein [Lactovum miscens]|uniref:Uncharacterized SAM-binding protein YcdF (DUF218 family) n=1 Tax=Lactovum miscens TaxID=190387 RepID=A0A841C9G8_9LACT|nr:YdcF family protein [Lactovum miscens]MBB5888368.1 uncharacterized SAM-binding protein YcdF (DUF218 family) [Lactovum miscens]
MKSNDILPLFLGIVSVVLIFLSIFFYCRSWKLSDFRTLKLGQNILNGIVLALIGLDFIVLTIAIYFGYPINGILFGLIIEGGVLVFVSFLISSLVIGSIIILTEKMWRNGSKSFSNFLLPSAFFLFLTLTIIYGLIGNFKSFHFNWFETLAMVYPILAVYISWEFLVFYVSSRSYGKRVKRIEAKYYVVHGAGLVNGSEVGHLLASRIEAAVNYANSDTFLVFSGGKGSDERLSEAKAMQKYAIEKLNFPKERTLLEEHSTTTYENLIKSAALIKEGFLIFTSDYHVFRAVLFAKKLNLDAQGGPSGKTALYYRIPAFMREFIAVMNFQKRKHVIVVSLIIAVFLFLAITSIVI